MVICRASEADFDQIWSVFQTIISTGDTYSFSPDTPKQVAYEYWLGSDTLTFVAKKEEAVLGFYKLLSNQRDLGSHVANASFMVNPSYRRMGVGKALSLHCLEEASKKGYQAMQFNYVKSTNQAALALYQSLGFKIIGTAPKAFKNLQLGDYVDVHMMHRFLAPLPA